MDKVKELLKWLDSADVVKVPDVAWDLSIQDFTSAYEVNEHTPQDAAMHLSYEDSDLNEYSFEFSYEDIEAGEWTEDSFKCVSICGTEFEFKTYMLLARSAPEGAVHGV